MPFDTECDITLNCRMNIWLDWNSYREGKTDSFSRDKGEPSKSYSCIEFWSVRVAASEDTVIPYCLTESRVRIKAFRNNKTKIILSSAVRV